MNPTLPTPTEGVTLYQQTAERLERLIHEGTLRAGERMPSVRALSRDWDLSISTVVQAYRVLENRGLVEARPQSGFYVLARRFRPLAEPPESKPSAEPQPVSRTQLQLQLLRDTAEPGLFRFGAAVPDVALLPATRLNRLAAAIARRRPARSIGYEFAPGARELRSAIARRMIGAGLQLTPEEILITSGGQEAMAIALRAVCRPGDTVAIESPTFYGVLNALEGLHLRAVEVPTNPQTGLCIEALQVLLDVHQPAAVVTIPNLQNPLGFVMPAERKKGLVDLLAERRIPLIEDDLYGELADGERPPCCKAFDASGNVLTLSSFSKTLAPGYRVGWIAPGRHRDQVLAAQLMCSFACGTTPQLAIAEFHEEGGYDHHLRGLRRELHERRNRLIDAAARYFPDGTTLTNPPGGFILWAQFPAAVDAMELHRLALRAGLSIAPGPLFTPGANHRSCARLSAAFMRPGTEPHAAKLGELATRLASAAHIAVDGSVGLQEGFAKPLEVCGSEFIHNFREISLPFKGGCYKQTVHRQPELSTEPIAITAQRAALVSSIRRRLAERLVHSRLTHVMGVEGMGVMLAHRWGVPADAVLLAALLHDYCKGLPKGELRATLEELSAFPATTEDRDHPELWHGLAAAQAAIDEFQVDDPHILQAVAHHTTGIPGLHPVGLVLYVADTFEPSRRYPLVEEHRRSLDKADLLEAALLAAKVKLQQLESANRTIHSNTRLMAEWLERETATAPTTGD